MPTSHHILFSHPNVDDILTITTGANQVSWAYNLNTVSYPTYAGEVVQVLSVNIDNLRIEGDVHSYKKMEQVYRWFLRYFQVATQGAGGVNYSESAVKMEYPHRGWTLYIKPIQLPQLRYGRDVVVPSWSMVAHIEDPDPEQRALAIDHAINGDVENFRARVTADIGFRRNNPFSDPLAVISEQEAKLYPKAKDIVGIKVGGDKPVKDPNWGEALQGLAKQMNDQFQALLNGKFEDLLEAQGIDKASGPTKGASTKQNQDTSTQIKSGSVSNPQFGDIPPLTPFTPALPDSDFVPGGG